MPLPGRAQRRAHDRASTARRFALHHVPSGILSGKLCVVGAGCVVDPGLLVDELDELEGRGISTETVRVSGNAHLIMPWHVAIDSASERQLGRLQIGTTRRGIGPAYADKAARIGIRVQDILDPKILRQKFETALAEKNVVLERIHGVPPLEVEELAEPHGGLRGRGCVRTSRTRRFWSTGRCSDGKRVLLEGAQGTLLDLDHGTYPFVTSSNPIAGAATTGVGIGPTRIDRVLGVAKAYVTRVGEGPFPTEIEGRSSRSACASSAPSTGRRPAASAAAAGSTSWGLRFAVRVNGMTSLALTKLDVLSAFDEIPVCTRYRLPDGVRDRGVPGTPERLPPRRARLRDAGRLEELARRGRVAGRPARRGARLCRLRRGAARRRGLPHLASGPSASASLRRAGSPASPDDGGPGSHSTTSRWPRPTGSRGRGARLLRRPARAPRGGEAAGSRGAGGAWFARPAGRAERRHDGHLRSRGRRRIRDCAPRAARHSTPWPRPARGRRPSRWSGTTGCPGTGASTPATRSATGSSCSPPSRTGIIAACAASNLFSAELEDTRSDPAAGGGLRPPRAAELGASRSARRSTSSAPGQSSFPVPLRVRLRGVAPRRRPGAPPCATRRASTSSSPATSSASRRGPRAPTASRTRRTGRCGS